FLQQLAIQSELGQCLFQQGVTAGQTDTQQGDTDTTPQQYQGAGRDGGKAVGVPEKHDDQQCQHSQAQQQHHQAQAQQQQQGSQTGALFLQLKDSETQARLAIRCQARQQTFAGFKQ